jgi:hypothetical protein
MAVEHQLSASFRTVAEPRYYLRNSVTANQRPKCSLPRSSVFCLLTSHLCLLPFAFCLFTSKPVPLVDVGPHSFHNAIFPFFESSDPLTHSVQFNPVPNHLLQAGIFIGLAGIHVPVSHHFNRFITRPFEPGNELTCLFEYPPFIDVKILHNG